MIPPRTPYLTQRNFILALAGAFFVVVIGFFAYEFKFLRAPKLVILAPTQDIISESTVLDVHGRTDPDADLTLNGRPLYSGKAGEFTERVYLAKGVNRLDFQAKNRYGKTAEIVRYVVVR